MGNSELPFGIDRSLLRLDGADPYLCLHFVIIWVRDQERSLRFFVDRLGFRVAVDHTFADGRRWIEVAPPDGNANIGLALIVERLVSTGTLLGLFEEWTCTMGECDLAPGDTLALYTDGVTEASNDDGEEFAEQGLIDSLRRHRDLPCHALLTAIADDVRTFDPHDQRDDITVILAKCRPPLSV